MFILVISGKKKKNVHDDAQKTNVDRIFWRQPRAYGLTPGRV